MAAVGRTARTLGLTLAGLVGGLLTVSHLLQRWPSDLAMGLSPSAFGLALAGYFWLVNRDRSILKGAGLTAISWATFWLAFIVAGGEVTSHLGLSRTSSADAVAFFSGGVVGSLVMSTATFSLYANAQPTLWRLLVCTIGGGLLGGTLLADDRDSRANAAVDRRTKGEIGEAQSALEGVRWRAR